MVSSLDFNAQIMILIGQTDAIGHRPSLNFITSFARALSPWFM